MLLKLRKVIPLNFQCCYSCVQVEKHQVNDTDLTVAVLKLNNPPVNTMSLQMLQETNKVLNELNESHSVNGIVLASNIPRRFTAGLELTELYNATTDSLRSLCEALQDTWIKLYSSPHPVVAAVNGHCLAGGTIFAASADYRIGASGRYKLGVTAARVGLIPPRFFQKTLAQVVGYRQAELMLTQARVFTPDEALEIGLLDEVCDGDDLVSRCVSSFGNFTGINSIARQQIKLQMRKGVIDEYLSIQEEEIDSFVSFVLQESIQKSLGDFIANLKQKK